MIRTPFHLLRLIPISFCAVVLSASAQDKAAPNVSPLPKTTPWNLEALNKAPAFEWSEGTQVRSLIFSGKPYQGKPTRVFAYYATPGTLAGDPSKDKQLPGIVLVHVGSATMPMLFVNGGKDFAYPPDSHAKTYALVKSPKNLHFVPDLKHGHVFDRPSAVEVFIKQCLEGGVPLARIAEPKLEGNQITAHVETRTKLVNAMLHYTVEALPDAPNTRTWISQPAEIADDQIRAELPKENITIWFLTVDDERQTTVSSRLVFPQSGGK